MERHRSRKLDRLVADQTVYHRIHIDQLHEFYRLTGAAIPETYAVRWQGYLAHPPRGV